MSKKEDINFELVQDITLYGNAFIHITTSGVRRIPPNELLKEAVKFSELLVEKLEVDE